MEFRRPHQAAQVLGRRHELRRGAGCDRGIWSQVVEIQCFSDGSHEFCQPILLELGHVRLTGQRRDVDAQHLGDRGDQVRTRRLVAALHLSEQAVRVRDLLSQPALGQPGPLAVVRDPGACVLTFGERH